MGSSQQVAVNGSEVWAYVVETGEGLRVRFALDDWLRLNLDVGRRVPVRMQGKPDQWLFITNVTELPPMAWVMLAKRVRAAV
jgi:hypothetical protein